MTSTTIARRFGLARKGSIAPGFDADLVVFDPATPFEFSTRTSHMNVDYDLFEGESSTGQRAPHALPRHAGLRPRRDRHPAGPRALRAEVARRPRRPCAT